MPSPSLESPRAPRERSAAGPADDAVRFAHGSELTVSPGNVTLVPGSAFRVAPLLVVADLRHSHLVVVGHTRVVVSPEGRLRFTVHVSASWATGELAVRLDPRSSQVTHRRATGKLEDWQVLDPEAPEVRREQETAVQAALRLVVSGHADPEAQATAVAKTLAERSRQAVAELRTLRYELERVLSGELRQASTRTLERLLADLLELSNAASRARDQARECAREGLWTWRSDDAAYHAQRRRQDRTLPPRPGTDGQVRRDWLHTLDAAVRHCQAIDAQLADEAAALRGLLSATSTMSVTRDARSSESFNLVASVGGIMLGLPALVLTLYGASSVLPLDSNYVALVPLAVAGLAAAVIAAFLPGRERSGKLRRFSFALLAVVVTLLLLAGAGSLVRPASPGEPAAPGGPDPTAPATTNAPG
ncbi:hypothetical protein [uncultured Modestobacter sp.]|uniref:hypothetical protein n=1 Tax=uncultured Modestobacter sp. TaxID=380048 RepID=UPI00260B7C48|nr:hypothetical protein [uncultured Modestobacter sp.]